MSAIIILTLLLLNELLQDQALQSVFTELMRGLGTFMLSLQSDMLLCTLCTNYTGKITNKYKNKKIQGLP